LLVSKAIGKAVKVCRRRAYVSANAIAPTLTLELFSKLIIEPLLLPLSSRTFQPLNAVGA